MSKFARLFEVQQNRRTYFPSLTGFRTIGAIFIFLHHFNPWKGSDTFMFHFMNELDFALPAFFALSGFLICLRYYDDFAFNKAWFIDYMRNRVARVYPLYFILTIIAFIPVFLHTENIVKEIGIFITNITFVKGFSDDLKFTGIAQGWSLTVEECFYFAAPVIFFLCRKKFKLWQQAIVLYLIGYLLVITIGRLNISGFFATYRFVGVYTFFGRCIEFFAGVQLALIYRKYPEPVGIWKKINFTLVGWTGIFGCSAIMSMTKGTESLGLFTPHGLFINNIILPFFICLMIWGLLKEQNPFHTLVRTRIFDIMGRASYAFYLIHLGVWHTFFVKYVSDNLFLYFIFIQISAVLLFLYVEDPLHNAVRAFRFSKLKSYFKKQKTTTLDQQPVVEPITTPQPVNISNMG